MKLQMAKPLQVLAYAMAVVVSTVHGGGVLLTEEQRQTVVEHGRLYTFLYVEAAADALRMRQSRFKVRPKFHFFDELIESVVRSPLNPARVSAFAGEDFVGRMASVTRSVHRRCSAWRVVDRYLLLLAELWPLEQ